MIIQMSRRDKEKLFFRLKEEYGNAIDFLFDLEKALGQIDDEISSRQTYFYREDIQDFWTKVKQKLMN